MKEYYGNYLGLCVNNDDPQKRGRVQVFIPHIMPSLYENWNEVGEDIQMICVGDNLPSSLTSPMLEKLTKMLPWAEAASPVIGTSAPGNLISSSNNSSSIYNQSPNAVASGTNAAINNLNGLLNDALQYAGGGTLGSTVRSRLFGNRGGSACGRGTVAVLGALTNNAAFQTGSAGGNAWDYALGGNAPSNVFANSGIYQGRQSLPSNYLNNPSQWQIGDIVAVANSSRTSGHIQVWTGSAWVSDFTQSGILTRGYDFSTAALHRLTPQGLAQTAGNVQQKYGGILTGEVSGGEGNESTSVGGTVAASSPQSAETPINENPDENNYGNVARPEIETQDGRVTNVGSLRDYIEGRVANSKLNGFVPTDGAKYGVDGSPKSWANHFIALGQAESNFNSNTTNTADPGGSYGIFQVSPFDGSRYGANPTGQNWTIAELRDPIINTNTAIAIYEKNVIRDGTIAGSTGKGAGGYFAATSMNKVANAAANGSIGQFNPNAPITTGNSLVNHPDPNGPTAVMNINNMAKGLFSYPAAGSLLWVFFREGDPNFPVYFATSYGASEWQSAYRQGSDVAGYQPAPRPENPVTSTGGNMNLGGVGGIRWEDTTVPDDPTKDQKSLAIYGYDGSNMFFNEGYHQIFSKFDRRDQVEGDRYESTLGFKEEWVQGDSNEVVMGDVFVKVGNVSKPALDAVSRIQEIIKEIMQPLAESNTECSGSGSGGGSSGGSSGTPPSKFTNKAKEDAKVPPPISLPDPRATIPGLAYSPSLTNEGVTQLADTARQAFNTTVNALYSSPTGPPTGPRGGRTGGLTAGQTQGSEGAASSAIGQGAT